MTAIQPLTLEAVQHIAWRMRESDRIEISAMMHKLAPNELAKLFVERSRFGFVACDGDEPIAAFGAVEVWPGRYETMMFATDSWPKVALSATREVKKRLIPAMLSSGLKLGFCFVHAAHNIAYRWLKSLGYQEQAAVPGWGKGGEEFKFMVWRA